MPSPGYRTTPIAIGALVAGILISTLITIAVLGTAIWLVSDAARDHALKLLWLPRPPPRLPLAASLPPRSTQSWGMSAFARPTKITFAEMRDAGCLSTGPMQERIHGLS
jgi:hypothetical protein